MKYVYIEGQPHTHYGRCSICDREFHRRDMEAIVYMGRHGAGCRECIDSFKRWLLSPKEQQA